MKQIGILMACGALALAFGCDNRGGGGTDSGIVVMIDGGGPQPDGGPTMPDGGPSGCSIPADLMAALPGECLPRCSAATRDTFYACTTAQCQQQAAQGDTTAPITVQGQPFGCSACVGYGQNSCFNTACPAEFGPYLTCIAATPMMDCSAQTAALQACVTANMAAVAACANPRVQGCFPAP